MVVGMGDNLKGSIASALTQPESITDRNNHPQIFFDTKCNLRFVTIAHLL